MLQDTVGTELGCGRQDRPDGFGFTETAQGFGHGAVHGGLDFGVEQNCDQSV